MGANSPTLTQPSNKPSPCATSKPKQGSDSYWLTMGWDIFQMFQSIPMAITLISLLLTGIMIGVFMPQEGTVDPQQIKVEYASQYALFKSMGLFNVYSAPWFLSVEVLFFFNLLCGSFKWLRPAYNSATQTTFLSSLHIEAQRQRSPLLSSPLEAHTIRQSLLSFLKGKGYSVSEKRDETNQETLLYATKGNWTRFGPATAHIGILCLLLASLFGAFTGFKGQKLGPPGTEFNFQQLDMISFPVGKDLWLGSIPDWKVKIHDFRIEYYPDHPSTVKQYYCDLEVLDGEGKPLKRETISVNTPLTLGDVSIYQASFAPTGKLFMNIDGKNQAVEVNTQFQDRQIATVPLSDGKSAVIFPFYAKQDNVPQDHVTIFLNEGGGFMGKPGQMPKNLRLPTGGSGTLEGHDFALIKPEFATGLQLKKGPEVIWMYGAFLIICIGTLMCLGSQRQLWFAMKPGPEGTLLQLVPKTNKSRHSFGQELTAMTQWMATHLQLSPTAQTSPNKPGA